MMQIVVLDGYTLNPGDLSFKIVPDVEQIISFFHQFDGFLYFRWLNVG